MTENKMRAAIIEKADALIELARGRFGPIDPVEHRFDLRGRTAGQALWPSGILRWNLDIACNHGPEQSRMFLAQTVPHEVAHHVARERHGPGPRSHGPEWQMYMRFFGVQPRRTHSMKASRARRQRYWMVRCGCGTRDMKARRRYVGQVLRCRACGEQVKVLWEALR